MISCANLSEKEKKAQEYMEQIALNTNKMLNLPTKVDEFTFAEKVRFDKKTNTIIYSYVIDKNDYGSDTEFKNTFKQIESEQIKRAIENQGKNPNYKTLGIVIKSIYKNKGNDILYSFDINPKDYIKTELQKSNIENNKNLVNSFSDNAFQVNFNQGINFTFVEKRNKDNKKWDYITNDSITTTILNLKTDIGNPFGEIIEKSEISIEIVLEYRAGIIKFQSKKYRDYLSVSDKLKDFNVTDFFKGKTTSLEELQKYADYLDVIRTYVVEDKSNQNQVEQNEKDKKSITQNTYKYSNSDLKRLEKNLEEFEVYFDNNEQYNYFIDLAKDTFSPNLINSKSHFSLRLFNDFDKIEDTNDIKQIPTINKFEAENAEVNIYLTASNTNGFNFNDLVKTINIKDKWNKHFVKFKKHEN